MGVREEEHVVLMRYSWVCGGDTGHFVTEIAEVVRVQRSGSVSESQRAVEAEAAVFQSYQRFG
jgi:hypothetical protein